MNFEQFLLEKKSEKWMQKAFNPAHKGELHKLLDVPEDEDIPMSKINAELKKLKGKEDLSKKELSLLRKLNLAKTAKKITESEELEFCPDCGHDWDECQCVKNNEEYSFLDEEDEIEEIDEKKKLNKGLQAFLDKKAGKKTDKKEDKEDKEGKTPTTKKEKELAAKYPPKDKITRGDVITAAKEKSKKK